MHNEKEEKQRDTKARPVEELDEKHNLKSCQYQRRVLSENSCTSRYGTCCDNIDYTF